MPGSVVLNVALPVAVTIYVDEAIKIQRQLDLQGREEKRGTHTVDNNADARNSTVHVPNTNSLIMTDFLFSP